MKSPNRALSDLLIDFESICENQLDSVSFAKEICQMLVGSWGYAAVWIGFADNNAERTVTPVAYSDQAEKYLSSVKISWDENHDTGNGPAGRAIREGKTQVVPNILDGISFMHPWWESAMKNGLLSLVVLPFITRSGGKGVLAIYASRFYAFPVEDVHILEQFAQLLGSHHP